MDSSKETCCLCLSESNSPLIALFSKNDGVLNYIDKLSSTLSQLANVLNNLGCDCRVCKKCCSTIEHIYNFNRICLQNARKYSSQKGIRVPEEVQVKKEVDNISQFLDACQVQIEVDEDNVKRESVEAEDSIARKTKNPPVIREELTLTEVTELCVKIDEDDQTLDTESIEWLSLLEEDLDTDVGEHKVPKGPVIFRERISPKKSQITCNTKGQPDRKKRKNNDFTCRVCNKTFKHASTLSQHKKIHSAVKPFVCENCGRGFNFKKNLNLHMLTHTGLKSHVCTTCNKAFSCSSNLKIHVRTHTGEKPYMCHVCGAPFATKDSLNRHSLVHTGLKPYECQLCKKTFRKKGHLNSHLMIHSGEKPYECKHCSKRFRQLSAHIRHTMLHTGERPHACTMCDKSFTTKWKLSEHKRSHSKNSSSS